MNRARHRRQQHDEIVLETRIQQFRNPQNNGSDGEGPTSTATRIIMSLVIATASIIIGFSIGQPILSIIGVLLAIGLAAVRL